MAQPTRTWAAVFCALAVALLCVVAPQNAGAADGPIAHISAELEGSTPLSGSGPLHDAPADHDPPGENEEDQEDEREFELAIPGVLVSMTGGAHPAAHSPAHLLLPRSQVLDTLEKPPRA